MLCEGISCFSSCLFFSCWKYLLKNFTFCSSCPDASSRAALKLVCDLYAMDRIWKDIGTYRNVDYVAPNKAKVDYFSLLPFHVCTIGLIEELEKPYYSLYWMKILNKNPILPKNSLVL